MPFGMRVVRHPGTSASTSGCQMPARSSSHCRIPAACSKRAGFLSVLHRPEYLAAGILSQSALLRGPPVRCCNPGYPCIPQGPSFSGCEPLPAGVLSRPARAVLQSGLPVYLTGPIPFRPARTGRQSLPYRPTCTEIRCLQLTVPSCSRLRGAESFVDAKPEPRRAVLQGTCPNRSWSCSPSPIGIAWIPLPNTFVRSAAVAPCGI